MGRSRILGRRTVTVALAYRDARPLFAYLQASGAWRPFFGSDRVLLSLDERTWFPLAARVVASDSAERRRWTVQNALPYEQPGRTLLDVRATSFATGGGAPPDTALAPNATNGGFRDLGGASLARRLGAAPMVPSDLAGLRPYRDGVFVDGARPADEVILSFARGLVWLKITESRRWRAPTTFGDVDELAAPIPIGAGVAYYEPATDLSGRRLSIHAPGWDLYLESTLPFADLVRVARSLPVTGIPAPAARMSRRLPAKAPAYALLPSDLPLGYRLAAADTADGAVTVYFRRRGWL